MAPDEAEESADSLEEVKVCDICGDAGFDDFLAICSRCNEGAEHLYCMVTTLDTVPPHWVCEECKVKEKKSSGEKRFACDGLVSMQTYKKQNVSRELSGFSVKRAFKNISSVQNSSSKQNFIENGTEHRISMQADKALSSGLSCLSLPGGGEFVKHKTKQIASGSSPTGHMREFGSKGSPTFTSKISAENIGPKPNPPSKGISTENATAEHLFVKQRSETAAPLEGALRVRGPSGLVVLAGSGSANEISSPRTDKAVSRNRPQANVEKVIRTDLPSISPKTITEKIEPSSNSPSKGKFVGEVVAPSEGMKGLVCLLGLVEGLFVKDTSSTGIEKSVSERGLQAYKEIIVSKDSTILSNFPCEGKSTDKTGRHILKQGGEAVEAAAVSSCLLRGTSGWLVSVKDEYMMDALSAGTNNKLVSGSRTAPVHPESALKQNVDAADKDDSNHLNFSADRSTSSSQRVLSKSVSMKSDNSEPSFLLPSRPKNLARSKSAIVQSTRKSPNRQEKLVTVAGKECNDHLFHARHEGARCEASNRIDSTKSTLAGSRPNTQAGLETGFRNVKYDQSPRDSKTSTYCILSPASRIRALRCYRCNEVGHLAKMCKGASSDRSRDGRRSEIPDPASGEKGLLAKRSDSVQGDRPFLGFQGHFDQRRPWGHELQSRKKEKFVRNSSKLESHAVDCVKVCSEQSPKTSDHTRIYENYIHEVESRKEAKLERKNSRSERSHTTDCVKMGSKQSSKPSEYTRVHEKQIVRVQGLDRQKADIVASSPPVHPSPVTSPKIGKHSPYQANATSQQAGPVEALIGGYLQEPQSNQAVLSTQQDKCGDVTTSILTSQEDLAFGSQCLADLAFGSQFPGSENFFPEMQALPDLLMLWSGCFYVSSSTSCSTSYKGMQAHPSNKADPKVLEAMMALPVELHLEEMKRGVETNSWPRSFQEHPPTGNSIGIYFFPVDMESHDTWYKPLLDRLSAHDLALRMKLEFAQLLIFPSQLLPEAEQCWDDRHYLWGVFRTNKGKETVKDSIPRALVASGPLCDGDHENDSGSLKVLPP